MAVIRVDLGFGVIGPSGDPIETGGRHTPRTTTGGKGKKGTAIIVVNRMIAVVGVSSSRGSSSSNSSSRRGHTHGIPALCMVTSHMGEGVVA